MNRMLSWMIQNSITMSFVIIFYMLATKILQKNYVAKWRYYSWVIPVLALLIPLRIPIPVLLKSESRFGRLLCQTQKISKSLPQTNAAISNYHQGISWNQILTFVWISGIILFFCYFVWKHIRFLAVIKRWRIKIKDKYILEIYHDLASEMQISNIPELIYCSCVQTPMMFGFFKPVLLLPHSDYAEADLKFLLKHELVHYQRKDIWYKLLIFLATVIYWFHPAVHWMAQEISAQCEISCDEEVIRNQEKAERKRYGNLILSMIESQTKMNTVFTTNFQNRKSQVKDRILYIMNGKKKRKGIVLTCMMLVLILATGITFQMIQPKVLPKKEEAVNNKQEDQQQETVKENDYDVIYTKNSKSKIYRDVDNYLYILNNKKENLTTVTDGDIKENGSSTVAVAE